MTEINSFKVKWSEKTLLNNITVLDGVVLYLQSYHSLCLLLIPLLSYINIKT